MALSKSLLAAAAGIDIPHEEEKQMNYEKHEFNIFPTNENDYKNIVKNMRENGYDITLPIIMFEGKILDGWNRYKASEEVGIKAEAIQFNGSREDALLYSIRTNKDRRHLGSSQLATLAVQAEPLFKAIEEETRKKQREKQREASIGNDSASKNGSGKKLPEPFSGSSNMPKENKKESSTRTAEKVAEIFNTNKDYINQAKKLKEESPEKFEQVMNGEKNFSEIKKEEKKEKYETKLKEFETHPPKKNDKYDLFHGSCLDYIPTLEDASIDLLLTDPPYGMDFKSGWVDKSKIQNDKIEDTTILFESVLSSVKSKLKDDAHIYIFGNIYYMEDIKPIIEKYYKLENIIIWDRKIIGMGNLKSYGPSFDIIYFCSNLKWKDLNGVRERDILQFERVSPSNLKHPTEKPLDLLKFLIKKSSKENDTILDPFAGGGSTIIAGIELNRNVKASEIEEKYVLLIRSKTN